MKAVLATLVLGAMGLGGVFYAIRGPAQAESDRAATGAVVRVHRGTLRVSVKAPGRIEAFENIKIYHEVEGSLTVSEVVPEGTIVQKNDMLVRFDSGKIEERLENIKNDLTQVKTARDIAEKQLEIAKEERAEQIRKAKVQLDTARRDEEKYLKGERPKMRKLLSNAIQKADFEREKAQAAYKAISDPRLEAKGYVTKIQKREEEIRVLMAESNYELAVKDRELYEQYTRKNLEVQKETDVLGAESNLKKVKAVNASIVIQKEADFWQKDEKFARVTERYAEWKEKLNQTVLRAPKPGMVIYQGSRSRHDRTPKPEVGKSFYRNQTIMVIPDESQLIVEADVLESEITKISRGMKVTVTSDVYPNLVIEGIVGRIGNVPEGNWYDTLKRFEVEVMLPPGHLNIMANVRAKCEFQVKEHENVLLIPLNAVFVRGRRTLAFVQDAGRIHARLLKLGASSETHIVVKEGLQEGDQVLLYEPADVVLPPEPEAPVAIKAGGGPRPSQASQGAHRSPDGKTGLRTWQRGTAGGKPSRDGKTGKRSAPKSGKPKGDSASGGSADS